MKKEIKIFYTATNKRECKQCDYKEMAKIEGTDTWCYMFKTCAIPCLEFKPITQRDKKPYILLILQHIPENIFFYLIPEESLTREQMKTLEFLHGIFIECNHSTGHVEAFNKIEVATGEADAALNTEYPKWVDVFKPYYIGKDNSVIEDVFISKMINTGVVL